jgi:hypothetical protein
MAAALEDTGRLAVLEPGDEERAFEVLELWLAGSRGEPASDAREPRGDDGSARVVGAADDGTGPPPRGER